MYRAGLSVNFLFRIVCFKFAGIPPKAGRRLFLRLFFGFLYGFLFGKFFAQEPEHRPQRVADQSEEKKIYGKPCPVHNRTGLLYSISQHAFLYIVFQLQNRYLHNAGK